LTDAVPDHPLQPVEAVEDLDDVWDDDPKVKAVVVEECEGLLRLIGVDDESLGEWRREHGV